MRKLLQIYGDASGKQLDFDKAQLFLSRNVGEDDANATKALRNVDLIHHHDRYLRLPSFVGSDRSLTFQELKSKVWHKLQSWKQKLLSQTRREILIKAVAQVLPTYIMSCFKLPKLLCKELESMFARFWWGQRRFECKIHWVSWTNLCDSKLNDALDFHNLENV